MRLASRLLHALFSTAPLALVLTALAYGVALAARHAEEAFTVPVTVGELVRFIPDPAAAGASDDPGEVVEAKRLTGWGMTAEATGEACRFGAVAVRRGGGSLVVVAREPGGGALRVRWAGGPTHATADCGSAADLRMGRDGFVALRNLAAFGVARLPEVAVP